MRIWLLGTLAEAAELFEQALAIQRAAGDRYGEAQVLQRIGNAHSQAGRLAEARDTWSRARSLFEALGEDERAAELVTQLAELDTEG